MSRSNNQVAVVEAVVEEVKTSSETERLTGKVNANKIQNRSDIKSILESNKSKSQKIRELYSITKDKSTVANLLNIKYQFVRNVLNQKTSN